MKKGKDSFYAKYIKRIFDFTLSLIALIVLSPLLLILAITGTIAMKGNPFFIQKRPGKIDPKTGEERIFSLIKFRTMDNRKDKDGNLLPDKQRLNKYGKFLRKTSLDESPEIINVFLNNMSFVGPRPLLVKYLPLYSEEQHHRHDVLPGITGYAQVHGRNSTTWDDRFKMDLQYVNTISFFGDVKVLFDTIKVVLDHSSIDSTTTETVTMEEFKGLEEKENEDAILHDL